MPLAKAPAQGPSAFPGSLREVQLSKGQPWGAGPGTLGRGDPESWPWTPPKEPGSPQDPGWEKVWKEADKQHSGGCTSYLVKRGLGRASLQSVVRAGQGTSRE